MSKGRKKNKSHSNATVCGYSVLKEFLRCAFAHNTKDFCGYAVELSANTIQKMSCNFRAVFVARTFRARAHLVVLLWLQRTP